jgi:sulfide:quinone oxidoreductase
MKRAVRPRVIIAGGGVAALETLLALRAMVGDRVDIAIVASEVKFFNRSMAVDQPSSVRGVRGVKLRDITGEFGARWHRATVERVVGERRAVVTEKGRELAYDRLVLALGAHAEREWHSEGVVTYHDAGDAHEYRRLLRQLVDGRVNSVAFVKPGGASWPLPLYELALATAARCDSRGARAELCLVTPETGPLEIFGALASAKLRAALEESGVRLYTSSHGAPSRPGRLYISPGNHRIEVDRIVTIPRLVGPALPGVPCAPDGFIRTDAYGRVLGMENVFAAGDATAFPIKQGGLAAQQADAVAESIAASVGAGVAPRPFRPVLRGLLTGGGAARYMRAHVATGAGDDCTVSERPLWWPPNRLCGRYLAPYLSSRVGAGAAMYQDQPATPVAVHLDAAAGDAPRCFGELADLQPAESSCRDPYQ